MIFDCIYDTDMLNALTYYLKYVKQLMNYAEFQDNKTYVGLGKRFNCPTGVLKRKTETYGN